MHSDIYTNQVELMLRVLPIVAKSELFVLKGGTAINFFIRNMPRLSVDIDLTYVPVEPREISLQKMNVEMENISGRIQKTFPGMRVGHPKTKDNQIIKRLIVDNREAKIKIEPNFILRGTLLPPVKRALCQEAQDSFQSYSEINCISTPELYAGKICAALDRQHPRDLFDIKLLYDNGGVTESIQKAFVVYLACSPRPMIELLNPNLLDIKTVFENEFQGMTNEPAELDELIAIREKLISDIRNQLTQPEKQFLLSIRLGEPKWSLMPFDNLSQLPALNWKLKNIKIMDGTKNKIGLKQLEHCLEI